MHLPRTLALLLPLVAVAGCGPGTPSATSSPTPDPVAASSPTSGNTDLEDLPLLAGWPDQEEIGSDGTVTGPARGMKPIEFTACGRTVGIDVTDRVDARISWIEDFRQRAVGRYADESAARAAADEVVHLFDRCPTEPQDALTEVHRVVGDPVAEVVRSSRPASGMTAPTRSASRASSSCSERTRWSCRPSAPRGWGRSVPGSWRRSRRVSSGRCSPS